jgi:glutathione peroxidase-family protein
LTHWNSLDYWNKLEPPLRPSTNVVNQFQEIIGPVKSLLVLGCTKELYSLASDVTVADQDQVRLNLLASDQKQFCGDWLKLKTLEKFDAVVGDGSLNCLKFPQQWQELIHICKGLTNGKVAIRVFETPDLIRFSSMIQEDLEAGKIKNFCSLKWELAMHMAYHEPSVRVKKIHQLFYMMFDKQKLSEQTGWSLESIDTIDAFKDSEMVLDFPREIHIKQAFPKVIRLNSEGYPFADRCPFYIF